MICLLHKPEDLGLIPQNPCQRVSLGTAVVQTMPVVPEPERWKQEDSWGSWTNQCGQTSKHHDSYWGRHLTWTSGPHKYTVSFFLSCTYIHPCMHMCTHTHTYTHKSTFIKNESLNFFDRIRNVIQNLIYAFLEHVTFLFLPLSVNFGFWDKVSDR